MEDELVYAKIGEEMEKARTAIKEVNRDNSCYEILTDFYTVARFFQKFAETPTGGLQALDETTKAYEKNIETYEIELELYVDEY